MPTARKDIVRDGQVGVYHCHSRCVRRAFLCGQDSYSGIDYEHRKQWVHSRLAWLAGLFAIDGVTCSVMSNHHHVILRTRPDLLDNWTDVEVARRWLQALPTRKRVDENWVPREPDEKEVVKIVADPQRMVTLRARLSKLSWFMACLNEYIARRANAEDGVTGRFFEGRFKSKALLDEAAIVACMVYVDLNPIRAKLADSPECSLFTGAYDRIVAKQAREKIKALGAARRAGAPEAPARGKLNEAQVVAIREAKHSRTRDRWLCRLDHRKNKCPGKQAAKLGLIPLSTEEYLELLDWTGRQIRAGKRGAIPGHLAPILKRLSLEVDTWMRMVEGFGDLFWRVVGRVEAMVKAARIAGKRWFKGLASSRSIYGAT